MQIRATSFFIVMLVAPAGCGSEGEAETRLAVKNSGSASIDATVSDDVTKLDFMNVAAGTTSSFQVATFGSLTELKVRVGEVTSTIDLTQSMGNVVAIGADAKVSGVSVVAPSSGSQGAW